MRTLLLDSDIIAYKNSAIKETTIQWDPEIFDELMVLSDLGAAKASVDKEISDLMLRAKADAVIVCLSDRSGRYFRHDILPTYKGQRTGRKPDLLDPLKDYLTEAYPTYVRPRLEADDVMGILQTHPTLIKGETVICTVDKDLRQIPGMHWDYKKKKIVEVTVEEGEYLFYFQTLTGDTVDHYEGCPGIGPKKAEKILPEIGSDERGPTPWEAIVKTYESKGLTEEDALVQARVSRMLRHGEYDYTNKEPILWNPN